MPLNAGHAYASRVQRAADSVLAYLCAEFPQAAPEVWAARLAAGEVEVDGVQVTGNERLRAGQRLVWHRPPWQEEAAPLHYDVLHEDAGLLAVNKPSGLPTLPGGGFQERTLLHLVRRAYPGASPLHRLGRGTSGVVLFARNGEAGAALSRAWRDGAVDKVYRALASGTPGWDTQEITTPIGPVSHPKLGQVYAAHPAGKPSRSVARVLERRAGSALLDVTIHTGRPHQIRIHLASVGHPLLGDPLYAPGGLPLPDALPGDLGYLLHAHTLSFTHPLGGQVMTVTAPPPPELVSGRS